MTRSKNPRCSHCRLTRKSPVVKPTPPKVLNKIICDKTRLQDIISEANARVDLIDARIAHFEVLLMDLRAEREATRQYAVKHEALRVVGYVNKLPFELLSTIFTLTLPTGNYYDQFIDPKSSPMVLGRVCRVWHAVSSATPPLWTVIPVDKHTVSSIKLWLQRAGSLPLVIIYEGSTGPTTRRVLDAVIARSPKWDTLQITEDAQSNEDAFWHLFKRIRGRIPELRCLNANVHDIPKTLFEDAPSLTEFASPTLHGDGLRLPWSQLVKFVGPVYVDSLTHSALPRMLSLEFCTFSIPEDFWPIPPTEPIVPVPLPHLRHIICTTAGLSCLGEISAPVLDKLEVVDVLTHGTWDVLRDFFRRSACPLTFLSIKFTSESRSPVGFRELLQACPKLTDLTISMFSSPSDMHTLMDVLNPTSVPNCDPPILPCLERLRYGSFNFADVAYSNTVKTIEALLRAVTSRCDGDKYANLKEVSIGVLEGSEFFPFELHAVWHALRARGVKMNWDNLDLGVSRELLEVMMHDDDISDLDYELDADYDDEDEDEDYGSYDDDEDHGSHDDDY
ncbi:hypothetical protein FISHEDRAFT_69687 [Fistulina hepatica ATCC 64428]|uniref:Uncharacterized protein n=1 Tax=Fistulina hepatica ATCC 64428 TaxID=1128425 RepID=A0A0D7APB5_9AGAR|nr:hypothetical protein FISHEDRAFT_69687 [Fistulina hepatica ATCC 64428]